MESVRIVLDDPEEYDRILRSGVPEAGDLVICSKSDVTHGGSPGVVIGFTASVDGKPVKVQAVTTLKLFLGAARAFRARHGGEL